MQGTTYWDPDTRRNVDVTGDTPLPVRPGTDLLVEAVFGADTHLDVEIPPGVGLLAVQSVQAGGYDGAYEFLGTVNGSSWVNVLGWDVNGEQVLGGPFSNLPAFFHVAGLKTFRINGEGMGRTQGTSSIKVRAARAPFSPVQIPLMYDQDTGHWSPLKFGLTSGLPVLVSGGSIQADTQLLRNTYSFWDNQAVAAGGTATNLVGGLDTPVERRLTLFGHSSAATTLTVQVSTDGATFYDTSLAVTLAGAGDFFLNEVLLCSYVRLKSSGAATLTAKLFA